MRPSVAVSSAKTDSIGKPIFSTRNSHVKHSDVSVALVITSMFPTGPVVVIGAAVVVVVAGAAVVVVVAAVVVAVVDAVVLEHEGGALAQSHPQQIS
jgi:hypothetical protein